MEGNKPKLEVERVQAHGYVSMLEILQAEDCGRRDHLNKVVLGSIVRDMVETILENKDILPVYVKRETRPINGGEIHSIRMNLISDDELNRLKMIEQEYHRILVNRQWDGEL